MNANEFRRMALKLPGAIESSHMGHPDFRINNKIFATLSPASDWGMVKLTPDQQKMFVQIDSENFVPFNGAWGRQGCTKVILKSVTKAQAQNALMTAWQNLAPADSDESDDGGSPPKRVRKREGQR